jgi:hypothetical protein
MACAEESISMEVVFLSHRVRPRSESRDGFVVTVVAPAGTPPAWVLPQLQAEAERRLRSGDWVQGCEYLYHWEDMGFVPWGGNG